MAVASPLSDTSPSDKSPSVTDPTVANEDSTAGAAGAAKDTQAAMHQQIEALQRQLRALQGSIDFVPKPKLAVVRTLGGAQLAYPPPGAEVPAPAPP